MRNERVRGRVGFAVYLYFEIYCVSILFQRQIVKVELAVELGFLLIYYLGVEILVLVFIPYSVKIATGYLSKLCVESTFCISAESMTVPTHTWNSGSCCIFCKMEMQIILVERRGKANPYHYSAIDIPKNLGCSRLCFYSYFLVICSIAIF